MLISLDNCYNHNREVFKNLYLVKSKIFFDDRGYNFESYNQKDFETAGLNKIFVQTNQSLSYKNSLRGMHFQKKHPQGKLIRVLSGLIYDVVVDLRLGSKTYGDYYGALLDGKDLTMLYVPEGFAHGYLTLSDEAVCSYMLTDFYHSEDEGGLMWNDPVIGIDWESVCPGITQNANLSEKDKNHGPFSLEKKYFDLNAKWIGKY